MSKSLVGRERKTYSLYGAGSAEDRSKTVKTNCDLWLGELEVEGGRGDGVYRGSQVISLDKRRDLATDDKRTILDLRDIFCFRRQS